MALTKQTVVHSYKNYSLLEFLDLGVNVVNNANS